MIKLEDVQRAAHKRYSNSLSSTDPILLSRFCVMDTGMMQTWSEQRVSLAANIVVIVAYLSIKEKDIIDEIISLEKQRERYDCRLKATATYILIVIGYCT